MQINRTASGLTITLDTDDMSDPYPTLLQLIGTVGFLADNAAGEHVGHEGDEDMPAKPAAHPELWDGILGGREPVIIADILRAAHDLVSNHNDADSLPLLDHEPSVTDGREVVSAE